MKTKPPETIETVKEQVVAAFEKANELGTPLIDAISDIARDVICRAVQAGADLEHTASGFMLGIFYETKEAGKAIFDTIRHSAHVAIIETAEAGGNLEATAMGLLSGAMHGAKEFEIDLHAATSAATDGILKAAEKAGATASSAVRNALTNHGKDVNAVDKKRDVARSKK